jgi:excisionase family DNA binding protein
VPDPLRHHYITILEAAEYLGVTERTIRQHCADGRLTAHRLGRRIVRLRVDEIDAAMQSSGGAA